MATLKYVFETTDANEAIDIANKLGIKLSPVHTSAGPVLPAAPGGLVPPAAPPAQAWQAPPAAAPTTPPAAPPAPVAPPVENDAADAAILAQGWSMDAHMKPAATALGQKYGANGPAKLAEIIAPYGAKKLKDLAPKHWPAVHAAIAAA